MNLAEMIRTERLATIEMLESLTSEEWATQSLCDAWTVRAVAAHVAWAPVTSVPAMLGGLARSAFRVNRYSAEAANQWSRRSPEEILGQLRENAATGAKPPGVPHLAPLSDAVVHGLDMRVPLGRPRAIPPDTFRLLADWHAGARFPATSLLGGSVRNRVGGLRLVADDVDWTHGEGPEVYASGATLLLVLAGRPVDPAELSGPGAVELAGRVAAT